MVVKRFQKQMFGQSPTYVCAACGKRTRETGLGESSVDLCAYCHEEAGLENELSDGHITEAEFDSKVAELKVRYDRKDEEAPKSSEPAAQESTSEPIGPEIDRQEIAAGMPYTKQGKLYVDVRAVVVAIDRFGRKWRNERSYTMRLYPE